MITLIHGDDTEASRNYLYELKSRAESPTIFEGDKVTVTDLAQEFDGGGLFQDTKTIIIEQLLGKKKAGKEKDALIAFIQDKTLEHEIILWEGKDLDKKTLSAFRHSNIKQFKLPQTLFLFLDNIKPNNGEQLVTLFHKVLETTDAEMVFFMLVRQFRLFLALQDKSTISIDEVKRLAPWQLGKLQKQAKLFSSDHLIHIYSQLAKIDRQSKTGDLPLPLGSAIDILLLGI